MASKGIARLEDLTSLDRVIAAIDRVVPAAIRRGPARLVLSGRWLGHSLHPLLTDLPVGCWMSAALLDLTGGARSRRAARGLVGWGLVFSLPTAATGISDWSHLATRDRRVGVVHAQCNAAALALYAASYVARRQAGPSGPEHAGVALGLLGGLAMSAGAFLGGHLTLNRAVTADNVLLDDDREALTNARGDMTHPVAY